MFFQIIQPSPALRPYISRYVYVRAEGSTDTMTPPEDDPHFVNGKHVQPLLPNYGSFIFVRESVIEIGDKRSDELMLLGANQKTLGLTTHIVHHREGFYPIGIPREILHFRRGSQLSAELRTLNQYRCQVRTTCINGGRITCRSRSDYQTLNCIYHLFIYDLPL